MADDLSSFIEQQKSKLEKERADLSRNGNYTSTSHDQENRRLESPKGFEIAKRNVKKESSPMNSKLNNVETGLPLGGYERIQQKLKEERRLEYNKYLAEKNMRLTGKVDPTLIEKDTSPLNTHKEENRRALDHSYEKSVRDSPAPRNRRKGKENWDWNDKYQDDRGSERYSLKESYEDILRRKRVDERKYRGDRFGYDGPDLDDELRLMKLSSRNYKFNSRSDGYISRRYDDDLDDEYELPRRGRRRREKSIESKRVRFHDDDDDYDNYDDINDKYWSKPRRRLVNNYDDNEDMDDLYALSQRRTRRADRRNSAHEERSINRPPLEKDSIRRTKTDSEIRSQSAPLLDGSGVIGGGQIETREMKIKRQEKYKRELDEQMKQQEENKKKEKMERFSKPETNGFDVEPNVSSKTPRSTSRTSAPSGQDAYDGPLGNNGPSSRLPQHPSLYSSPYDDPYYYYGRQERGGGPLTMALQDPLFKSSGYGVTGLYDADAGSPADPYQSRSKQTKITRTPAPRRDYVGDHTHKPPGGYSNLSGIGQGSLEADNVQSKRAAQQAYQEELKKQMELRDKQKQKEKEEKERYDRKMDEEIAKYDPWGKGGAGAPLRDISGQVIADLRGVQQDGKSGKTSASPRGVPPPVEVRFDKQPQQDAYADHKTVNTSPFGRSDPLKERQPHDDLKEKARLEYQHYLKQQVEEKERKKKEEQEKIRQEEEREEKRLQAQRDKMQKEFQEEQEKIKRKEEEAKRQNEMLIEAQNAKRKEAERKRKEMEEKRQEELRKKLDENINAAKRTDSGSTTNFRTDSPPIPTIHKQQEGKENIAMTRGSSPPVPALAKLQKQDSSPHPQKPSSPFQSSVPQRQPSAQSRQVKIEPDTDVLSQLTALRQQLKQEEQKVQSQIGHTTATAKYSQMGRVENESRSKREVNVFDRALTNKPGSFRKTDSDYSPAEDFNRMKQEDTSSLAGEFRSRFPQPATTDSMLDLQQQEYLREQEDKLSSLKAGLGRSKLEPNSIEGPSRSKSKESLLESESQFITVDDPAQVLPVSQTDMRPRQPSARERRRWKQLEEMAKEPKPYDVYKPPTPGGFSLNSVTSFNIDEVANKNEERLKRIEAIRRAGGGGGNSDPDDVLKQFMSERRRPLTRASEASLEAETSYEPLPF